MHDVARAPSLRVDYAEPGTLAQWLAREDVLAAFGFGDTAPPGDDPRYLRVPLQPRQTSPSTWLIWPSRAVAP